MKLPFTQRTSTNPKSAIASTLKKRFCSKFRAVCCRKYSLIFLAFVLLCPNYVLIHSQDHAFRVATGEAPVLNETGDITFSNTPVNSLRPQNQFFSPSLWNTIGNTIGKARIREPSILTVITVTKNPREVLRHTARFILEQSLFPIRWLIVNDHTDVKRSYELLEEIASLDPRFDLLNSTRPSGFSNGRIYALKNLLETPTKYFAFLDDDDYFEYTAYEKCVWTLESNFNASMCGTYVIGFGERNYTWKYGFHDGYKVVVNNPLTGSEILRTSVLETDCEFDKSLQTGMEDWDFYLCLASRGLWGVTVPEYLFWYRINPESFRKKRWGSLFEQRDQISREIRKRYKELERDFPRVAIDSTTDFEYINLSLPIKNELHLKKSILMIIPWMSNGDGDISNLRLVQKFSTKGYRVTIVCTLLNLRDNSMVSRSLFMQYTHDIFTIPAIVRLADAPRFLAYLIRSRNVQTVLISNSQLGYGMLPWLSARFPGVAFIDYVHSLEPDRKNGGYASFSRIHQSSLDATFTSSASVRQFITEQCCYSSVIEVENIGTNLKYLHPLQDQKQAAARLTLGIPAEPIVILFLARTVAYRRAKVATAAFLQVAKGIGENSAASMSNKLRLLIIGDGPAMEEVKRISAPYGNAVSILGNLRHSEVLKYIELSNIFCLASPSNLVSFVLTDSRKIGLDALTSTRGGYPEMLIQNTSNAIILKHSGKSKDDVVALTGLLKTAVNHVTSRKKEKVSNYAQHIRNPNKRSTEFVDLILAVKRTRRFNRGANMELSTLHYALFLVLREVGVFSDFPEIHKIMQSRARTAYGTRYRAICGEHDGSVGRLLDLLENPKPCVEGEELDIQRMKNASMLQCWRWCIMDLDNPKRQSGWQAKENCQGFLTFDDPAHQCSTWYKSLPAEKRF